MQVGKTKDQGLYNKPSATVHPGALAVGTLLQYNIAWDFQLLLYPLYPISVFPFGSCGDFRGVEGE